MQQLALLFHQLCHRQEPWSHRSLLPDLEVPHVEHKQAAARVLQVSEQRVAFQSEWQVEPQAEFELQVV